MKTYSMRLCDLAFNSVARQSARGLAHSRTLRAVRWSSASAPAVLDCGGPPPLFHRAPNPPANSNALCRVRPTQPRSEGLQIMALTRALRLALFPAGL